MLVSLGRSHYIRSNRESGLGRYEVLLIPKEDARAVLLEFTQVRQEEELESALQQIQAQSYHTELLQYPHVNEVVEVGIAFSGKTVVEIYAIYDLVHKKAGEIILTNRYRQGEG